MNAALCQKIEKSKLCQCQHCGRLKVVRLRRNITGSGVNQFFWWCTGCERQAVKGGRYIPHQVIDHWIASGKIPGIDAIQIINDYSVKQFCEVCGVTGAEYHHFAPQALSELFGDDWYLWPGAYLCRPHHNLWHSIVTFFMPGPAAPHPEMIAKYGTSNVPSR